MSRIQLYIAALLGTLMPLVFDSALKGAALLAAAALTSLALYKASAATRHLVWLVAIVALLIVPVLSIALPQWRVLPNWATSPLAGAAVEQESAAKPGNRIGQPHSSNLPPEGPSASQPVASSASYSPNSSSRVSLPSLPPEPLQSAAPASATRTWRDWLPLAWTAGFLLLALRLVAAHILLRRASRGCATLTAPPDEVIARAFTEACVQLGVRQRVTLLLDKRRTIPVVWGVFRPRLLLPAEARQWSQDQLRSVLLHELAHIRRRDTLVQWLTQIACALHWWNPLVWLAAWRLHTERERACDDLVLASGIRPSAYAEHLLHVATKLSPASWTQACGLAMARKSSLEGRLLAVLSEKLNRRGVTSALAAMALLLGAGIAIPVAMLRAADEKWDPPHAAHVGGNDFSTYCVHDGKTAAFVIVYRGDFGSSSDHSSNSKTRTWHDAVTLALKTPGGRKEIALRREHTAPDKLTLAGKDYDLTAGRVFLVSDNGESIRQLGLNPPAIDGRADADALKKQLAAIPPQKREEIALKPKHEYAQSLFRKWQALARTDGKIPGALLGHVAREMENFIKQRPSDEQSAKFTALLPRLDVTHDWAQADVVALFDDITAIATAPISWADLPMDFSSMRAVQGGQPLPVELKNAAWGEPVANGLHAAWLLEPPAEEYPLGTVLKARVLFHNTGKAPVVFMTETWHQADSHAARDAKGAAIKVNSTWYSGITPTAKFRLAPGEYCEVKGHGIAIGAGEYKEEHSIGSVGATIEAKLGDEVSLSHSVDTTYGGWSRPNDPKNPAELWKATIAERVANEAPMPASRADREQLVRRVSQDIFGEPPTPTEIVAFAIDNSPDALAKLTARLQEKPRVEPFSGKLPTGETKFRVVAADPNAAKKPGAANAPGRYILGENAHLLVSQTTTEASRTNKATIAFLSPDPKVASPYAPYEIALPDGLSSYAIAWSRGSGSLWVTQKGLVRKYDFSDPAQVKETRFESGGIDNVPEQLREALKSALNAGAEPETRQASQKTGAPTKLQPGMEENLKWGETVSGVRAAVVIRHSTENPKVGDMPDLYLAIQNVSQAPVRLSDANVPADVNLRELSVKSDGRIQAILGTREPAMGDITIQPREVTYLPMFGLGKIADKQSTGALMAEGLLKDTHQSFAIAFTIDKAPAGAWTGKLVSGDATGYAATGQPQPRSKEAQALLSVWIHHARANGSLPGGLIARLADKVNEFIRANTGDAGGDSYAKKMMPLVSRLDASHDWKPSNVVALFDDIAAVTPIPLETTLEETAERTFTRGQPLPGNLASAPWGEPQQSGLRMAWLLEPRAAMLPLGTPLKSRILFHNSGKDVVVFRTRSWHQVGHKAVDAKGADIKVESTTWLTLGRLTAFRLWPGEFVEVTGPGIGLGPLGKQEDWQNTNVGSWVEAKAGDDVTITSGPVPLNDWNENPEKNGDSGWWLGFIKSHLTQDLPMPTDADERKHLVYRAGMELFGTPISAKEIADFVSDRSPTALDALAKRFASRPGTKAYTGDLSSAPTKFRVLPADPDAAKKPRTANNPGQYPLGGNATLAVTRRLIGDRTVNEAHIAFSPSDATKPAPSEPHKIHLPDGYDTWAAAWKPGGTVLWVKQKWGISSYDFTDASQVKESDIDANAPIDKETQPIFDTLRAAFAVPDAPAASGAPAAPPASVRPAPGAPKKGGADANPPDKFRIASKTGVYDLGGGRSLYVCKPNGGEQRFSILWKAAEQSQKRLVKLLPNVANREGWAVVFEPGTDVLWWADDADVGKVQFADAARVIVDREDRKGDLSPSFALTDGIKEQFRMLGFSIGREPSNGGAAPAGIKPSQEILTAKPLDSTVSLDDEPDAAAKSGGAGTTKVSASNDKPQRPKLSDENYTKSGVPIQQAEDPIDTWSDEKHGLCIGLRVVDQEDWHVGDAIKIELWACNPGEKDVKFAQNPRADVGLSVSAKGKDGKNHFASIGNISAYPVFNRLLLPPGNLVKLKEFTIHFDSPENEEQRWMAAKLQLPPGQYELRCTWNDAHPLVAAEGEWTGEIESGPFSFKLLPKAAQGAATPANAEKPGNDPAYGTGPVTPLMYAAASGSAETARRLIAQGEDVNARTGDKNPTGAIVGGLTPLLIACRDGHYDIAKLLLDAGAQIEKAKSANGRFPLFEALAGTKDEAAALKFMTLLLDHGANANQFEGHVGSTLHMAVTRNWKAVVRLLVERGAEPNAGLKGFKKPVELARENGLNEMAALLEELIKSSAAAKAQLPKLAAADAPAAAADLKKPGKYPPVHARGDWSAEFLALCKTVAASRSLVDWKPEDLIAWGAESEGLRSGLLIPKRARIGDRVATRFVIRNTTGETKDLRTCTSLNVLQPSVRTADGKAIDVLKVMLLGADAVVPVTLKAGEQFEFEGPPVQFGVEKNANTNLQTTPPWPICGVNIGPGTALLKFNLANVPAPETGEVAIEIEAAKLADNAREPAGAETAELLQIAEQLVKLRMERVTLALKFSPESERIKGLDKRIAELEAKRKFLEPASGTSGIRGRILKPDGTPASGVSVRIDDGIERWKWSGQGFAELPKPVVTVADGTFSIAVPGQSVAENYHLFAWSDNFAPVDKAVPPGGDMGALLLGKPSRVTGRVTGLDGAGLAKIGIWPRRLEWKGRGYYPAALTATNDRGEFALPTLASGKYMLQIVTRDIGPKELAVAFANQTIEVKDDEPQALTIRPLPTVDLTFNVRVIRKNPAFPEFDLQIWGTLPGHVAGEPEGMWSRQERAKLTEGMHTIAIPAGMSEVSVMATGVHARKGDSPVFIWRRGDAEKREVAYRLQLGLVNEPQKLAVTAQDAASLNLSITGPDGKAVQNIEMRGAVDCEAWGRLALEDWDQSNFPDHNERVAYFPACEKATFTIKAPGCAPVTQELGIIKGGERKDLTFRLKAESQANDTNSNEKAGASEAAAPAKRLELQRAEAEFERLRRMEAQKAVSTEELDKAAMRVEVLKAEAGGDKNAAADARLKYAETALKRIAALREQNAVSEAEFDKARFDLEVAKAERAEDKGAASRARLEYAEGNLKRVMALRDQKLLSEEEIDKARLEVDLAKAELTGDAAAAARARVAYAEVQLNRIAALRDKKIAGEEDFEKARFDLELAKADLAGDKDAASRARVMQAEAQLKRITVLREQKLAGEDALDKARFDLDIAKADLTGDKGAATRARVLQAEVQLKRVSELHANKQISTAELENARAALDAAHAASAEVKSTENAIAGIGTNTNDPRFQEAILRALGRFAEADALKADQAAAPDPKASRTVTVTLLADGTPSVDGKAMSLVDLAAHLTQARKVNPDVGAVIVSAKEAPYTSVVKALDAIQRAGIGAAGLKTEARSVTVTLLASGAPSIDGKEMSLADFEARLAQTRKENPAVTLVLVAPKGVAYDKVTAALNAIQHSGITTIGLATADAKRDDASAALSANPQRIETLRALVANRERAMAIAREAANAGRESSTAVLKSTMELIEAKLELARTENRASDEPALLRELLAAQEQILAETRLRRNSGIATETEVLEAEQAVLRTKVRLIDSGSTADQSKRQ